MPASYDDPSRDGAAAPAGLRRRHGGGGAAQADGGETIREEPSLVEEIGQKATAGGGGADDERRHRRDGSMRRSESEQCAEYASDYKTLLGGGGDSMSGGLHASNGSDVGLHVSNGSLGANLTGRGEFNADAVVDAVRLEHYSTAVGLHDEQGCNGGAAAVGSSPGINDSAGGDRFPRRARTPSLSFAPSASSAAAASPSAAGGLGDDYARGVVVVDAHFKSVAFGALLTYFTLVSLSYYFCPPENIVRLEGTERNAAGMAASLLFVACLSNLLPLMYRARKRAFSGVIVGAMVVQFCAMMTDFAMATLPTPVMLDPVVGTRVHLLRWCEWTPLAFLMTFLTIGTDVPDSSVVSGEGKAGDDRWRMLNLRTAYVHAWAQGVSTLCGLAFPFCPGPKSWWTVMIISWVLFVFIYERLYVRTRAFQAMTIPGASISEQEVYNRARLSLKLLCTCAVMWSTLVVMYTFSTVAPLYAPEGSLLADPALTMVCECIMDVLAKILYLTVIVDVHDAVFDHGARAERRLEELRQMMSVVWDNSSDVIGISVRSISGTVTTMLSPTYLKICVGGGSPSAADHANSKDGANAVVFELGSNEFNRGRTDDDKGSSSGGLSAPMQPSVGSLPSPSRRVEPRIVYNVEFSSIANPAAQAFRSSLDGPPGNTGESSHDDGAAQTPEKKVYGNASASSSSESPRVSPAEMSSMADLLVRAWDVVDTPAETKTKETLLMHDLVRVRDGRRHAIRCEAKITRLEENAIVVVMRDISERFRRFEAEKRVISETTARQKDAEANRFTRHEVKNGLLAAIGLCDSLRDTMSKELRVTSSRSVSAGADTSSSSVEARDVTRTGDSSVENSLQLVQTLAESIGAMQSAANADALRAGESSSSTATSGGQIATDLARCLGELDKTLHEVLDTILAEAMARDVIHEVYEPKLERVDIGSILCGSSFPSTLRSTGIERFPLITHPSPLPLFAFDPQLFKYIHRNAVSNACKYGKKGGVVMTEVRYDEISSVLEMDVINLPGEHHGELLKMGTSARDAVFSPRRRLHTGFGKKGASGRDSTNTNVLDTHSSGDGAWIMHKCAKTLGGDCDIRFESNRTVFSLRCVATPFDVAMKMATSVDPVNFKLPKSIWGIAIDDSKIQRKLLERFLMLVGVKRDRCIVLGKDADEIRGFDDFVVQHIDEHPNDYLFVIADENLDVVEEAGAARHVTVSGSLCIENIRHRLQPDQERRMLALVRSANDSSHDVAIYNSRAHGFLPKAPIQRDRVLEMLAPIWERRYPPGVASASDGQQPINRTASVERFTDESTADLISRQDLLGEIEDLDALCSQEDDDARIAPRWPLIWERLHLLKGDLKSLPSNGRASAAVEMINALRGPALPPNFRGRWLAIRALVVSIRSS